MRRNKSLCAVARGGREDWRRPRETSSSFSLPGSRNARPLLVKTLPGKGPGNALIDPCFRQQSHGFPRSSTRKALLSNNLRQKQLSAPEPSASLRVHLRPSAAKISCSWLLFMLQSPRGLSGCSFHGPCVDSVSAALPGWAHEFLGVPDQLIQRDGAIGVGVDP